MVTPTNRHFQWGGSEVVKIHPAHCSYVEFPEGKRPQRQVARLSEWGCSQRAGIEFGTPGNAKEM